MGDGRGKVRNGSRSTRSTYTCFALKVATQSVSLQSIKRTSKSRVHTKQSLNNEITTRRSKWQPTSTSRVEQKNRRKKKDGDTFSTLSPYRQYVHVVDHPKCPGSTPRAAAENSKLGTEHKRVINTREPRIAVSPAHTFLFFFGSNGERGPFRRSLPLHGGLRCTTVVSIHPHVQSSLDSPSTTSTG